MPIPRYRHPDETYKSLWKWQKANPDQPITPALVDRCLELSMDEFAAVLDLCRVRGWVPRRSGSYWMFMPGLPQSLVDYIYEYTARDRTLYGLVSRDLCGCYAKLLAVQGA